MRSLTAASASSLTFCRPPRVWLPTPPAICCSASRSRSSRASRASVGALSARADSRVLSAFSMSRSFTYTPPLLTAFVLPRCGWLSTAGTSSVSFFTFHVVSPWPFQSTTSSAHPPSASLLTFVWPPSVFSPISASTSVFHSSAPSFPLLLAPRFSILPLRSSISIAVFLFYVIFPFSLLLCTAALVSKAICCHEQQRAHCVGH